MINLKKRPICDDTYDDGDPRLAEFVTPEVAEGALDTESARFNAEIARLMGANRILTQALFLLYYEPENPDNRARAREVLDDICAFNYDEE